MIPIGDSLLWTRPVYVKSQTVGQPQVRLVVAYYNGEIGFGESLEAALVQLFPGLSIDLGDVVGAPVAPVDPADPGSETASTLLQRAEKLFNEADAALKDGDLGTYQVKVDEAKILVAQALDLLDT